MGKPFDATLQELTDTFADDWAAYLCGLLGIPPGPAEPIESDLSATLQADKLFRLREPATGFLHVEFQASWEDGLPGKVMRYNAFADWKIGSPIHSIVLLLRPEANSSELTGRFERTGANGRRYLEFRYDVIRVREQPLTPLLEGPLGLLPLAPLTGEARPVVPSVLKRMEDRFTAEKTPVSTANYLRGATYFLLGLQFKSDEIERFYSGITGMEESSTFQHVKRLGGLESRREDILELGLERFAGDSEDIRRRLESIQDLDRLGRIHRRILNASGWDDLLSTP